MFAPDREQSGNPSATGFQTDVRRRTNLSTATNALRSAAIEAQNDSLGPSSLQRLSEIEDELNRVVDKDVETLVEGVEEIVHLSNMVSPDKLRSLQDSLAIELRAETMVRSCTSLMGLSHFMKMLWLMGDETQGKKIQDQRIDALTAEIHSLKMDARRLMHQLQSLHLYPTTAQLDSPSIHHQLDPSSPPPSSSTINMTT